MKNIKLSGKISFIWLLALAALLYTGIRLVKEADSNREAAVQVFTENGTYPSLNNTFVDLMR